MSCRSATWGTLVAWSSVVGAGICGLAAAYELRKRGVEVARARAAAAPASRSALARIFRIAHRDPRLCELALEARAGWRAWEREFGLHLLGDEGLVVANGMWVGEPMPARRARAGPAAARDHPYEATCDPLAGSLRIRRRAAALAAGSTVRRGDGRRRSTPTGPCTRGETLRANAVVVCAGLGTQALIDPLGIDLEMTTEPHVRVTYEGTGACLISPDCYALPDRAHRPLRDRHARPGRATRPRSGTSGRSAAIECVSLFAPWLDNGDGFVAYRAGRVIALGAGNAMKFGPLLGCRGSRRYGPEAWSPVARRPSRVPSSSAGWGSRTPTTPASCTAASS